MDVALVNATAMELHFAATHLSEKAAILRGVCRSNNKLCDWLVNEDCEMLWNKKSDCFVLASLPGTSFPSMSSD